MSEEEFKRQYLGEFVPDEMYGVSTEDLIRISRSSIYDPKERRKAKRIIEQRMGRND